MHVTENTTTTANQWRRLLPDFTREPIKSSIEMSESVKKKVSKSSKELSETERKRQKVQKATSESLLFVMFLISMKDSYSYFYIAE